MITQVFNYTNPVGFDFQVRQMQDELAKLNLIEAIFGVARMQVELRDDSSTEDKYLLPDLGRKGKEKHERWYPQGDKYGSNVDLTIDDSYSSRIFFLAKDPIITNPQEDEWGWPEGNPELCQSFSIIFHCNIQKIRNQFLGVNSTEQVKLLLISSLNKIPLLIVKSMSENIENVWKEFSMTAEVNGFGLNPFYVLRFDCEICYYPLGINGGQLIQLPRYLVGWKVCKVLCNVVSVPSGATQTLANGDVIPLEYALNNDNTVTMPYLNSVNGISLLTYFSIKGEFFEGNFFIGGKLNTSRFGDLGLGDNLMFDASLPLWSS